MHQQETKIIEVGFQGEEGAFSEQAARLIWPDARLVGCRSFDDVVAMVRANAVAGGVLPVANRIVGRVADGIEALRRAPEVVVVRTVELPVALHLAGCPGASLGDIRRVMGHPVAMAQCQRYLAGHPSLVVEDHYDSAAAAKYSSEARDPTIAVIAGLPAIVRWGLQVIEPDVQDIGDNVTRFIGIRRRS